MSPQDTALYKQLADEIDELEERKAAIQAVIDKKRMERRELLREKMTEEER